jgi:hypothetical protein
MLNVVLVIPSRLNSKRVRHTMIYLQIFLGGLGRGARRERDETNRLRKKLHRKGCEQSIIYFNNSSLNDHES